ncbi:cytochrome c oxidase subunit I [Fontivita pretiosa]|uniref:cytochrome c oxidase subunit I n=1 Tax=Fontivita pretiosa TaxID=2989684 RepID=UPI003D1725A7
MTAIPRPLDYVHDESHEHAHVHHEIGFVRKYIFSCDHKIIGIQFLFMGLLFMILGGMLAMLIRWQLKDPGQPVPILSKLMGWPGGMPPDFYMMVMTMHATIMIFFVIIVLLVGTFGNYLIPLKIGAGDMAFPFLNGLAFWSALPAGAIMLAAFFLPGGAAAAGWTSYPPLSAIQYNGAGPVAYAANLLRPANSTWPMTPVILQFLAQSLFIGYICAYYVNVGNKYADRILGTALAIVGGVILTRLVQPVAFDGQSAWFFSIFWLGFSSLMGAVNYLTTVIKLRCPGMTMFRLPLSVWSLFITSLLVLLATPVLASALMVNLLDHHRWTSFFLPFNWTLSGQVQANSGGGYALLHQHLFWFYSHPAVYIMILPAMGMTSDILATFARKPIFGYRPMVYAIAGIAFLGFIVWAHHMFQSGMNPTLATSFAVSTMFIAVPSAIKTFNWLGTLWRGNIRFTVPMCNALAFVSMFVIGGLSGIFMASTAVDVHIHDTYFIVAHIHYVLFGGSMFGIFAAIYYYYPKMFGRMMNDKLGYIHFVLSFIFFNGTFFAMHILGIRGFPRRIADYLNYTSFSDLQPMNEFISWCAFGLGLSQIPFVINFIGSWIWGKKAPRNPWEATTLEWETESPPPHGNFAKVPVVHHGPYEYASPLVEEDYLPQTRYVPGAEKLVVKH